MDQGTVSTSVILYEGAKPQTIWTPGFDEEPAFLVYSLTKTFLATLILKICELEKLSLADPLSRWFPSIDRAENISLQQLLNHTAGIPDYGGIREYHESVRSSPTTPWSFERFASKTFGTGLLFEPGTGWTYSNPGYMLVKYIAEAVMGAPFRTLLSELITEPLGLRRTFVPETINDLSALAPGTSSYLSPDGSLRDIRTHYHPGWVSHGVVASTTSDVVRFLDVLMHGKILSWSSLARMKELVLIPSAMSDPLSRWKKPGYGLGLMGDPDSPYGMVFGHNGGGPCYNISAFHAAELGGVSVCTIGALEVGFNAEDIVFDILDRLSTGKSKEGAHHRVSEDL